MGGKGVASVPYLLRSAALPGGWGWQIRTRWWPGGHVAQSGPTWLQKRWWPWSEVQPQHSSDPSSCLESQGPVGGGGGVYTTQNSAEPVGEGRGAGPLSASDKCVTSAAWTPVPSPPPPRTPFSCRRRPEGAAGGLGWAASWGGETGAGGPGEA